MFQLHAPTLSFLVILVTITTGLLLLLSWLQNREVSSLAWWGSSHLVGAVSVFLFAARGSVSNFLTMEISNALLILAFAMSWAGMRRFSGKSLSFLVLFAPAAAWIVLCRFDLFVGSMEARIIASSLTIVGYTLASAWQLWRIAGERLVSRYPAIGWLLIHALFFGARVPLVFFMTPPSPEAIVTSNWFSIVAFEALLNVIAMSFLQIAMIRERAENQQRRAALTDALTGAPNRRAILQDADRMLQRAARAGQPVCMLLIDIDHFKAINDNFGHDGGDLVLVGVADAMRGHLRANDLFGRFGGEEFVCLLPDTPITVGLAVAEGLRLRVANMRMANARGVIHVSVSIGVAESNADTAQIADLLLDADRNLYEAKATGRNRVSAPEAEAFGKLRVA